MITGDCDLYRLFLSTCIMTTFVGMLLFFVAIVAVAGVVETTHAFSFAATTSSFKIRWQPPSRTIPVNVVRYDATNTIPSEDDEVAEAEKAIQPETRQDGKNRRTSFFVSNLKMSRIGSTKSWSPLTLLLMTILIATIVTSSSNIALAEQDKEYRQGIEVTAFNGLIFNYRGGQFNGLDASTLEGPSMSYADFMAHLSRDDGDIVLVEFLAPNGDVAYATFKDGSKLRIGQGYPIEQSDGYSSPLFAIRAVKNANVPYKFIVPGLTK